MKRALKIAFYETEKETKARRVKTNNDTGKFQDMFGCFESRFACFVKSLSFLRISSEHETQIKTISRRWHIEILAEKPATLSRIAKAKLTRKVLNGSNVGLRNQNSTSVTFSASLHANWTVFVDFVGTKKLMRSIFTRWENDWHTMNFVVTRLLLELVRDVEMLSN